ncbi:MAG TPA: hypothetical protein VEF05_07860 [Terriglobales bacterium]|nr:hypothetical protein [Terriglobales bacterium]
MYFPEPLYVKGDPPLTVPVKLSVLRDCVSWRDKASPLIVPDIIAIVPQEVPFPVKVTGPKIELPNCVNGTVA